MKEIKSVLMVIPTFYPVVGGSEKQCFEISSQLASRGVKVTVLTRRVDPALPAEEMINGFTVLRKDCGGPLLWDSLVFMLRVFFYIFKNKNSYQAIHAHMMTSAALGAAAAGKFAGLKTVVKMAGGKGVDEISLSEKTLAGKLKLFFLKMTNPEILVMNKEVLDWVSSGGYSGLNLRLFKNGVDTAKYKTPLLDEKNAAKERIGAFSKNILFVGRLSPEKRIREFVEIFSEILLEYRGGENVRLLIVGSGPQEWKIRETVRAAGLEDKVLLYGNRYELFDYYSASEIFMLPSVSEGLSNSMLEAMSCGLAVMAGRVGAAKELIKDGENGCLFDPMNPAEIKKCAKKMIECAELKEIGARNRKIAVENYSMNSVLDELLKVYSA